MAGRLISRLTVTGIAWMTMVLFGNSAGWAQSLVPVSAAVPQPDTDVPAEIRILPENPRSSALESSFLQPGVDPQNRLGLPFLSHLVGDQQQFWTSPAHLGKSDARTLVPFSAFTGLLFASDAWISRQVPDQPNQLRRSQDISNYGVYSLVGAASGAFLWGQVTNNDHLSETGLLGGEAALNSTATTFLLKRVTQRARPSAGGTGSFFQGGSSFSSEHSAIAWSVASVIAHEYPGPLTQFLVYGLASSVTLTRVTSKQHFASDAVVGSVLGWYFGRQVYRAHHDSQSGGGAWGPLLAERDEPPRPRRLASPYVPLDSWIYPAMDRLAALGYLKGAFLGMRPWTRLECARLLDESTDLAPYGDSDADEVSRLSRQLSSEFVVERAQLEGGRNIDIGPDSVYTRVMNISGPVLNDSFHFGQTIVDDGGRPYGSGLNLITGASAHAIVGPVAFSLRGEYQQAPALPLYSESTLQAISQIDGAPLFPNQTAAVDRFRVRESMVAVRAGNVQLSFGKQGVDLGPTRSGSLLLSDNAEPFTMLRIESVSPFELPLVSRVLGPIKSTFFLGQLSGHNWVFDGTKFIGPNLDPQPYIHGEKISFEPTPNLELGFGVTAVFSGPGLPFTWHNLLRTYYSHKADLTQNPGKRFSSFDVSYRVPGLRKWLTVYTDSLVVDEISPLGSTRPSLNPGLYFPQIPKVAKLELRVEGLKTSHSGVFPLSPGFVYTDRRYLSGYTNNGNILGNWIGRAGIGGQAWATYHLSPRNQVELSYRHAEVDHAFLQGGRLNDFSVSTNFMLRPDLSFSTLLQYEVWKFPLLSPAGQSNFTTSFQFEWRPSWRVR